MRKSEHVLSVATKHGPHVARGWFAILALMVIIIVPTVLLAM